MPDLPAEEKVVRSKRIASVSAFALLGASVWAQSALTGVDVKAIAGATTVRVRGESLARPKVISAYGGTSYILQFAAKLSSKARRLAVKAGGVRYVQYGWYKSRPPTVRVHLKLTGAKQPKLSRELDGSWTVIVGNPVVAQSQSIETVLGYKAQAPISPKESDDQAMRYALAVLDGNTADPPAPKPKPPVRKPKQIKERAFPEVVPPLTKPVLLALDAPKLVTLDFTNTDIEQIMKALAMQAGVNIVTSPEITGKLTVSLDRVPLDQAIDFVTLMAGARYARLGNTFVVTTPDRYADLVRRIGGKSVEPNLTRVVPIFSGEGAQIKAAVLKSVPLETDSGAYEIVLQSEDLNIGKSQTVGPDTTPAPQSGSKPANGGTIIESKANSDRAKPKDQYLVLIGPASRLNEVEPLVKALDAQVCMAMGAVYPTSSANISATYKVNGSSAEEMLRVLGVKEGMIGAVEAVATPVSSTSGQTIALKGREHEVRAVLKTLADLDTIGQAEDAFQAYDVKYVDPRSLREELISAVAGLRVTIPPASAGNPRLYVPQEIKAQSRETTQAPGQQSSNGSNSGGSQPPSTNDATGVKGSDGLGTGLEQPFNGMESIAVPMRIILRGTTDQIRRAVDYLQVIDIAPKQIAIDLRVMELSREEALRFGIDWNALTGGAVKTIRLNQSLSTPGSNSATGRVSGRGFDIGIAATLDQISNKNNLITRPNMLAIDGRESEIFVGDTIRYIESIQSTQNGVTVQTSSVKIGVRLAVFPRISGDGQIITMDMRPVVSFLKGFTAVPGGGQIPQTSDRIAQNTLAVRSGETIAIGGLIQEQDIRNVSKVPILGDIPILGQLFRRVDNNRQRKEIVFFLTASVVKEGDRESAAAPTDAERRNPNPASITGKKGG